MERKPSRDDSKPQSDVNGLPKKLGGEVSSEHKLQLEDLRFRDQTHRKLRVGVVLVLLQVIALLLNIV